MRPPSFRWFAGPQCRALDIGVPSPGGMVLGGGLWGAGGMRRAGRSPQERRQGPWRSRVRAGALCPPRTQNSARHPEEGSRLPRPRRHQDSLRLPAPACGRRSSPGPPLERGRSSAGRGSAAGSAATGTVSPSAPVSVPLSSADRGHLLQCHLHLRGPYFQTRSQSEVLGLRTAAHLLEETQCNPQVPPKPFGGSSLLRK